MTEATDAETVPHLYGAGELGVLAVTAPGEAHPRVEYVGGEVFLGLDVDGKPLTQGQAEGDPIPFPQRLREQLPSDVAAPEPVDGVIVIEDDAEAAAVLLGSRTAHEADLDGEPVVFALSRTRVVMVGGSSESALARALDLAEAVFDAGGPVVSAHPIVRTAEGWGPFTWRERAVALAPRFERVLRLFSVRAYEAQTRALKRPDVYLADPKIRVLDSGVTTTFATWPQGTAALLPVVDNIVIADPAGSLSVATMDQFLDAGGDAIVRTGLSPLRYFVPGNPPPSEAA